MGEWQVLCGSQTHTARTRRHEINHSYFNLFRVRSLKEWVRCECQYVSVYSVFHPLTHSYTHILTHIIIHSLTHPLIQYSLTHSLTLTYPPSHSRTHSPLSPSITHSLTTHSLGNPITTTSEQHNPQPVSNFSLTHYSLTRQCNHHYLRATKPSTGFQFLNHWVFG